MGTVRKEVVIGMLVSIFATAGGLFLYLQYFSKYGFDETIQLIKEAGLYGKVISLAAIPNLFVFFVFLKKKQDHRAKGVLLMTILIAVLTLVLKFL
jgi:Na+-driven multidrug efflux pump